jgi:hypothetical protein
MAEDLAAAQRGYPGQMLYVVRAELEVSLGEREHASGYSARLDTRIREQEGAAIQRARVLFRGRRGPFHGLATATITVQARDQGSAVATTLRAIRAAAGEEARAWEISRARVTAEPARRA